MAMRAVDALMEMMELEVNLALVQQQLFAMKSELLAQR